MRNADSRPGDAGDRSSLGRLGEDLAAWYLTGRGLRVIGRNIRVGSGELDLLAIDGCARTVVEVRATTGSVDPLDAADERKRRRVRALARSAGCDRVDFIGIRVDPAGFDVHWLPGGG